MKKLSALLIFAIAAAGAAAEPVPVSADGRTTDKIKLSAAYCLNSNWFFRVYDGISNRSFELSMGVENAKGFKITAFDEATQTADIQTPYGDFKIGMFKAGETMARGAVGAQSRQQATAAGAAGARQQGGAAITRGAVLERMK